MVSVIKVLNHLSTWLPSLGTGHKIKVDLEADIVSGWLSNQISILKVMRVLDFELRGRSILR